MKTEGNPAVAGAGAGSDLWLRMYRGMQMIRLFEEQVNQLYTRAVMPGLAHLYIGEEAVAVGICEALNRDEREVVRGDGLTAGPFRLDRERA